MSKYFSIDTTSFYKSLWINLYIGTILFTWTEDRFCGMSIKSRVAYFELSESWKNLARKTTYLNKIVNIVTTLAERGYIIMVHKGVDDSGRYLVELYVRYDGAVSHSGFVGIGDDLESALDDLVSDERLDFGEAE